jgi:hypothetical protein
VQILSSFHKQLKEVWAMKITPSHYVLDRDHPYLRLMELSFYQSPLGHWRVKWRDFLMMKQDDDFATEQEARDFYNEIWSTAHLIDRSLVEDGCMTFDEAESHWLEMA